jgi:hypothetical protein
VKAGKLKRGAIALMFSAYPLSQKNFQVKSETSQIFPDVSFRTTKKGMVDAP